MVYPPQQFLDYLTRQDELLIALDKTLIAVNETLRQGSPVSQAIQTDSLVALKNALESGTIVPYKILRYPMDAAQVDLLETIEGRNIISGTDGTLDGCFVKLNSEHFDRYPLSYFDWEAPFFRIYLTWTAQPGRTLYIAVGKGALGKAIVKPMGGMSYRLLRWGREVDPAWIHAAEVVAPGAGQVLVTRAVTAGTVGYVYGFFISVQEPNNFLLNWTSGGIARSKRLVFGAGGSVEDVNPIPINEGLPADAATNITITNVTIGGAGIIYQANLLYVEV